MFGGGGAGSSAGPPLSTGGTGVEGLEAKPGAGGAVVDGGGGVHSIGNSGSCSARLASPAAAQGTRMSSEASLRSGNIGRSGKGSGNRQEKSEGRNNRKEACVERKVASIFWVCLAATSVAFKRSIVQQATTNHVKKSTELEPLTGQQHGCKKKR